jgi:hypothetical protein
MWWVVIFLCDKSHFLLLQLNWSIYEFFGHFWTYSKAHTMMCWLFVEISSFWCDPKKKTNFKIICILCAILAIFNFICLYFFFLYIYILHALLGAFGLCGCRFFQLALIIGMWLCNIIVYCTFNFCWCNNGKFLFFLLP